MPTSVSVVIPTYNPSEALREAIDSALAQTQPPREVIVVDDGSTVDTSWVPAAYGSRIRFLRKANGGPASARNAGCRLAVGDLIAFLDADDAWEPKKLAVQTAVFARHQDVGLVYGPVTRVDRDGRPALEAGASPYRPSGRIAEALFLKNVVPTSTVMIRRRCLDETGGFDEDPRLISVEDYDLWLRMAERYEAVCVEQPLVRYRLHPAGISRNTNRSYSGERLVVEKAVARRAAHAPVRRAVLRRRLAQLHLEWGQEHFQANAFGEARQQFIRALRYVPWHPTAWAFALGSCGGQPLADGVRGLRRARAARREAKAARTQRVVHVLFSLHTGGAEHLALDLLARLDPHRYERHVVSLTGDGPLADRFRAEGMVVHVVHKRPGVDAALWIRLWRLLRTVRPDVVHTHNVTPWLYAGPAAWACGARLIHTEHSNLFAHQGRLRLAERWLAGVTDAIVCDSEKVKRQLVDEQGLPEEQLVTIVNGIDVARFGRPGDAQAVRCTLGINGATPVIGTVGRLAPVKDHETLLEAFRLAAPQLPGAVLLIVGDGPVRAGLEARAQALGVADRVKFLGRRTDVAELLEIFDVFVLSSASEGMPLTILEAMAAGKPVVSTRVGGIPEIIEDGRTGLLVPARSPGALADALTRLAQDRMLQHTLGRAARDRVRAQHTLDHMVQAYESLYASVTGQ